MSILCQHQQNCAGDAAVALHVCVCVPVRAHTHECILVCAHTRAQVRESRHVDQGTRPSSSRTAVRTAVRGRAKEGFGPPTPTPWPSPGGRRDRFVWTWALGLAGPGVGAACDRGTRLAGSWALLCGGTEPGRRSRSPLVPGVSPGGPRHKGAPARRVQRPSDAPGARKRG